VSEIDDLDDLVERARIVRLIERRLDELRQKAKTMNYLARIDLQNRIAELEELVDRIEDAQHLETKERP